MRVTDSQSHLNEGDSHRGCWKRKTGLEQKLTVFSVFLSLLTLALIIALAIVVSQKDAPKLEVSVTTEKSPASTTQAAPYKICYSSECNSSARYLMETMDFEADPCQDFYQYACGKWNQQPDFPNDKGRWGVFDKLRVELAETCIGELEKKAGEEDSQAVRYAKAIYKGCLETEESANRDTGLSNLEAIVTSVEGNSWSETLINSIRNFGYSFIISLSVQANLENPKENTISLDQQSSFGIARTILIESESNPEHQDIISAYQTFASEIYCMALNKTLSENCLESTETKNWAKKYFEFEVQLAKASRSPIERRNISSWNCPMTILDLSENAPNLDWLNLIQKSLENLTAESGINEESFVLVKEKDYLQKITDAIVDDEEKSEIADEYIKIRLLMSVGGFLSKEFREKQFEFNQKVINITQMPKVNEVCFELANKYFGHAVGRLYIEAKQFDKETKQEMLNMIKDLETSFGKLVDENDWMDPDTKRESKTKLALMGKMIGYPDFSKDNDQLDEYYNFTANSIVEESYFQLVESTLQSSARRSLSKLSRENNRTKDWVSAASIVNAFYSPSLNTITFPAGILQDPFFVPKRHKAMNYGAIGYVIGHEITHGFDDSGRQFDGEGSFNNWWTSETLESFIVKKECFEDQYSNVTDDQVNMNLNGKQTIGENIADNGGIREAYEAYMESGRDPKRLPGEALEELSDEKLFFIAAASVWCSHFKDGELIQQIMNGVHSPGKYRASIPLSNTKSFSQVFGCKAGSNMNLSKPCVIW